MLVPVSPSPTSLSTESRCSLFYIILWTNVLIIWANGVRSYVLFSSKHLTWSFSKGIVIDLFNYLYIFHWGLYMSKYLI